MLELVLSWLYPTRYKRGKLEQTNKISPLFNKKGEGGVDVKLFILLANFLKIYNLEITGGLNNMKKNDDFNPVTSRENCKLVFR